MAKMFGVERIIDGSKRAILAPATVGDHYKLSTDDTWHHIDELEVGSDVHAVDHYGRQQSVQGDIMTLSAIESTLSVDVQVMSIRLIRANQLTAQELSDLGPPDGYGDWVEAMGDRRGWFMQVIPIVEGPVQ